MQVEQTKQGVRSPLPPPCQKRICIYGTLLRLPLGNAAIFEEAGSPGALIQWQTTDWHTRTCTSARTNTFPIPSRVGLSNTQTPSMKNKKWLCLSLPVHCHLSPSEALIKMERFDWNDWLKWKSFVWASCDCNNTEMTCAVLLATTPEPCLSRRKVV